MLWCGHVERFRCGFAIISLRLGRHAAAHLLIATSLLWYTPHPAMAVCCSSSSPHSLPHLTRCRRQPSKVCNIILVIIVCEPKAGANISPKSASPRADIAEVVAAIAK